MFAGMAKGSSLSLDPNWLHYNQITITGKFGSVPNMLQQAARLASNGYVDLSKMVNHGYSLANIQNRMTYITKPETI
jgi:L-iditol 2-dehydrogenase